MMINMNMLHKTEVDANVAGDKTGPSMLDGSARRGGYLTQPPLPILPHLNQKVFLQVIIPGRFLRLARLLVKEMVIDWYS